MLYQSILSKGHVWKTIWLYMINSAFIKYILVRYYQHILTNMVKRNKSMHCLLIDLIIMMFIMLYLKGLKCFPCPQNQIQQAFVLKVEFLIDIYFSCLLETFLAAGQNLKDIYFLNFFIFHFPNNVLKLKICLIVSTPCFTLLCLFFPLDVYDVGYLAVDRQIHF